MRKVLFILLPMLAFPVQAQDSNCANPRTQSDLNICSYRDWKTADDELNRLWKIVKPRADARGQGQALLNAQRAWIAYRDATCQAEANEYAGGSIMPLVRNACAERLTLRRNDELRAMR